MENRHHHLKRARGDVVYDTIIFIILTLLFLIVAYPLYSSSFPPFPTQSRCPPARWS